MKRILHDVNQNIEIALWHECNPADTTMDFGDTVFALSFLRRFMSNPLNMSTLRDVSANGFSTTGLSRLTDHEILQHLAGQITRGYVKLVPKPEEARYAALGGRPSEAATSGATTESTEAAVGSADRAEAEMTTTAPWSDAAPVAAEPIAEAISSSTAEPIQTAVDNIYSLLVATDLEPEELVDCEDEFILTSSGGQDAYSASLRPKEESIEIQGNICLEFQGLSRHANYTLKVKTHYGQEVTVFKDVPYTQLSQLSEDIESRSIEPL